MSIQSTDTTKPASADPVNSENPEELNLISSKRINNSSDDETGYKTSTDTIQNKNEGLAPDEDIMFDKYG